MKRVNISSRGRCWLGILNRVDAVVVCTNPGQAITPVDQRKSGCSALPSDSDFLAAPPSCLKELIVRQGGQDTDLNTNATRNFKLSDRHLWKVSGSPFEGCPHNDSDTQTCWDRNNLLQEVTTQSLLFNGATSGVIPHFGAVVFGRHRLSVRNSLRSGRAPLCKSFCRQQHRNLF
jgi:hypothetical protein